MLLKVIERIVIVQKKNPSTNLTFFSKETARLFKHGEGNTELCIMKFDNNATTSVRTVTINTFSSRALQPTFSSMTDNCMSLEV